MNHNDDLRQKLWELEYGLLSDDEAAALQERIAADANIAATHQRVRQQASLVAEAARLDVPRILVTGTSGDEPVKSSSAPRSARDRFAPADIRRILSWTIGIAASLLVGLFGYAVFESQTSRLRTMAAVPQEDARKAAPAVPLKIEVAGPARLHPEALNQYSIATSNPTGEPTPAELQLQLSDAQGLVQHSADVVTDSAGKAYFAVPPQFAKNVSKMEVVALNAPAPPVQLQLAAANESYRTYLTTDRPRYRRGETVRFRSVTLSRFGRQPSSDVRIEYSVTDPSGNALPPPTHSSTIENGVGSGEFTVGEDFVEGQYTLAAQSPDGRFPDARRDFYVRGDQAARWNVTLNWARPEYRPATEAAGTILVRTPDGEPAGDLKVRGEAYVDGHPLNLSQSEGRTNERGEFPFSLSLPSEIGAGEGLLFVSAEGEEALVERIPIRLQTVTVDLYPEGGDLIAGLESRVYFHSHDAIERPVTIRGKVRASNGRELTTFATEHEGRGVFRLTPEENESYSLEITEPADMTTTARVPAARPAPGVVLDAGPGVFARQEPLRIQLRSPSPPPELLLAVNCRGALVAHQTVAAADFANGTCDVELPVPEDAAGVMRVTVFDQVEPLAERLVYKQPQQTLSVEVAQLEPGYAPRSSVQLDFMCRNERREPVSAVLGISVVDEAVLRLERPPAPNLVSHFLLLGEIDAPEKLEDANFYLNDAPESKIALDLLLGTQGWRRFQSIPTTQLAGSDVRMQNAYAFKDLSSGGAAQGLEVQSNASDHMYYSRPENESLVDFGLERPLVLDNSAELGQLVKQPAEPTPARLPTPAPAAPQLPLIWIIATAYAGLLLIFCAAALLFRLASSRRMAVAGVLVSSLAVLIGVLGGLSRDTGARGAIAQTTESAPAALADRASGNDLRDVDLREDASEPAADLKLGAAVDRMQTGQEPPVTEGVTRGLERPDVDRSLFERAGGTAQGTAIQASDTERTDSPSPPAGVVPKAAEPAAGPAAMGAPRAASSSERFEDAPTPADEAPATPALAPANSASSRTGAVAGGMGGAAPPRGPAGVSRSQMGRRSRAAAVEPLPAKALGVAQEEAAVESLPRRPLAEAPKPVRERSSTDSLEVRAGMSGVEMKQSLRAGSNGIALERSRRNVEATERELLRVYAHRLERDTATPDFSETLYWNPLLITGSDGRATVDFDLSDSATRYRIQVDAHQDGRLASDTEQIVVKGRAGGDE